ncbi:hypothetical protein HOLleu_40076 [Holothuria leucospilota]|uniref:Uncharacterized protein n=1 Tax=Holothuria leucospilota TaxID=206669 RepID=A0A9Q1BDC7_HOLLE|nr:hypothetical protein HOLleu_40076 [Holothuria leucospilota]
MDIDSALNELGMLSAITDSRKDYQTEQEKSKESSCFHVVTANPQFVVNIGAVQHKTSSSKKSSQKVGESGDHTDSAKTDSSHLERAANDHRSYKVSGRLHHRYFFRPYLKNGSPRRHLGIVKEIQNRSRDGHFHIRLPPPAEATLTQAMASMNIERESTSSRPRNSLRNPPLDIRNRTGLRAHAR